MVHEEALKYETRGEFRSESNKAYQAAKKRGMLDEVCNHMAKVVPVFWSVELIKIEALEYKYRGEFRSNNASAYNAAIRLGILDEVCSHMGTKLTKWTKKMIQVEALKYYGRGDFKDGSCGAYRAARERSILDSICAHMTTKYTVWTKEMLHNEALKYDDFGELRSKSKTAYNLIVRRGLVGEACSHMTKDRNQTDNDCLYVWQIEDTNIYKIGITSMKLGFERIQRVANKHNVKSVITALIKVDDAKKIEKELHEVYQATQDLIIEGDGFSEFKTLTRTELIEILDYLNQEKIEGVLNYPL